MKKDSLFDVTLGPYDGAEVCELVGTFLLDKISVKYDKNNTGLYRDNSTLTKNLTTLLILLSTCQHWSKTVFKQFFR